MIRFFSCLIFAMWATTANSMPITDTVEVGGLEWAQPDLFTSITWDAVNDVCPESQAGLCEDGTVDGWEMNGWQWASIDNVNGLFNIFLSAAGVSGDDLLSGPDIYLAPVGNASWATSFFDSGFRPNASSNQLLTGIVIDLLNGVTPYNANMSKSSFDSGSSAYIFNPLFGTQSTPVQGAWFYRSAASPVPAPSVLGMMITGWLALIGARRRRNA